MIILWLFNETQVAALELSLRPNYCAKSKYSILRLCFFLKKVNPNHNESNLLLYKIQNVLEVQVIIIVSNSLLDVGMEDSIHLGK